MCNSGLIGQMPEDTKPEGLDSKLLKGHEQATPQEIIVDEGDAEEETSSLGFPPMIEIPSISAVIGFLLLGAFFAGLLVSRLLSRH